MWMLRSLVLCCRLHSPVAGMRECEMDSVMRPAAGPLRVCRTNSAGHSPVQQSTSAKGLRLCYTDLNQTVHVLIGSVSCGLDVRTVVRSRGPSHGAGAQEQVAVGVLPVQVVSTCQSILAVCSADAPGHKGATVTLSLVPSGRLCRVLFGYSPWAPTQKLERCSIFEPASACSGPLTFTSSTLHSRVTVGTGVLFLTKVLISSFFQGWLILKYVYVAVGLYFLRVLLMWEVLLRAPVPFVVFLTEQDGEHVPE